VLAALLLTISAPVTLDVQWDRTLARTNRFSFGLNTFVSFNPETATDLRYAELLREMRPGLLRLHHAAMAGDSRKDANGWIDYASRRWDEPKILRAMNRPWPKDCELLMNIPNWPTWMDANRDGFLDADQEAPYARLCADLVRIVNRGPRRVRYWEPTNERDMPYFVDFRTDGGRGPLKDPAKPARTADLARIYNLCVLEMKRVDPRILVGGPAVARPDLLEFVREFAKLTRHNLDFFSYHAYASGSREDTDAHIYDRALAFGPIAKGVRDTVRQATGRKIPLFLDEYNVSWTWETHDPRMTDNKGAVFDTLAAFSSVTSGADATTAWNDRDGVYGKIAPDNRMRAPGANLSLLNRYAVGRLVKATSSKPNQILGFGCIGKAGRTVWIVNRSPEERSVKLVGVRPQRLTLHRNSAEGWEQHLRDIGKDGTLPVPAHSVTTLVLRR